MDTMRTMTLEGVLARLSGVKGVLAASYGVAELYVFGSVARGDATAASDVDILVAFDGPARLDRFLDLAEYLEALLETRVDLVTTAGAKPRLLSRIQSEMVRAA